MAGHAAFLTAEKALTLMEKAGKALDFEALGPVLDFLPTIGASLGVIGASLSLIHALETEKNFEVMLQNFEKVNQGIHKLESDITRLTEEMAWEHTVLSYGRVVNLIQTGMDELQMIGRSKEAPDQKARYEVRLMDLCKSGDMTLAVNSLLTGITGHGFFNFNILDSFYTKSFGNRPEMAKLGTVLLNQALAGVMVLVAYNCLKFKSEAGGNDIVRDYQPKLTAASKSVKAALQKCLSHTKANMQTDLERTIQDNGGKNNSDMAKILLHKFAAKFDFMYVVCLVTNSKPHHEAISVMGTYVHKSNFHGKNSFVFYRRKDFPFLGAHASSTGEKIVKGVDKTVKDIGAAHNMLSSLLKSNHVPYCAVVLIGKDLSPSQQNNFKAERFFPADGHFFGFLALE